MGVFRQPPGEEHFGPIWFIPGRNKGRYPYCHSVYVEGAGVLIDPAGERERLRELKRAPGVREVWLTHWHEDHLMSLDLFDDVPLRMSGQDAAPLSDLEMFLDAYGLGDRDDRASWRTILQEQFHFRPREPAGLLRDGERIALGAVTAEVIHTPGHTPGHLAFFFREPGVLVLGDYDLTRFGPWYGDVESSIEATRASVARLREVPARVWIALHEQGLFRAPPGELWDHYLNVIAERERKLLQFLEEPKTLDEITGEWILYGKPREPRKFFEFGERAHMKKHLEKLMRQGVVESDGERYWRCSVT